MYFIGLLIFATFIITSSRAVDEVYTPAELKALKEFHEEVKNDLYLPYQSNDRYLINWLRNKKLNVAEASTALRTSLKYRKDNDIDNVIVEDKMLEMQKMYPATFGASVDKLGNPAYQLHFSKWDIRKAVLSGKLEQLFRFNFFTFENAMKSARERNATNFIYFPDMSGYNLRQHACLACFPFYIELVTTYERHFPNTVRYIIAINTPQIFESVTRIIIPLMSPPTRKVFKVFGTDKSEWQRFVLEVFDAEQLTKQFGGNKKT